jgi:hypothetical protein
VAPTEIALASQAGQPTLLGPRVARRRDHQHVLAGGVGDRVLLGLDSVVPPSDRFIATIPGWSAAARIALMIAEVGQPAAAADALHVDLHVRAGAGHARHAHRGAGHGAGGVRAVARRVERGEVRQVALPLPAAAWLYQSQPAIRRPVNSGWLKSTPVSMLPITTSPPPAAIPSMASSSESSVLA